MKAIWSSLAALVLAMTPGVVPAQESKPDQTAEPAQQAHEAQFKDQLLFTQGGKEQIGEVRWSLAFTNALISSNDLGVDVAEIQPSLRAQLNLAEGSGLVVTGVPADSPGAKAGLAVHDVIVNVGSDAVGNTEQLAEALKKAEGKPVKVGLLRQGKSMIVEVTPKSPWVAEVVLADTPVKLYSRLSPAAQEERYRIGVVLSEADDTLRAQVGLAAGEGLIVSEVYPDTPAAKTGIQVHDVLVILDGKRLTTVDAVNAQIQEIKEREVELKLLRSGKEVTLKIAPVKESHAVLADFDRQALTLWHAGRCPGQTQSQNCRSCHTDPFPEWKPSFAHDYHALRSWIANQPAAAGSPQEQVNQLKEQLAKVQQTLAALEASLQSSAAKEPEGHREKDGKEGK